MANTKAPPKKSEEYKNFENLAKQLFRVSKKELDEKIAEYGRKKKQQNPSKTRRP